MKWLWFVLIFIIGGLIGFFAGTTGGVMVGGITGTEYGVCVAVQVAEEKGILTADQAQELLDESAVHLRTEFKELVEQAKLSEKMPLNAETCQKIKAELIKNN